MFLPPSLKLENFLFSTAEPGAPLKLIDFGLSKYIEKQEDGSAPKRPKGALGSSLYIAPEMVKGDCSFDHQADCWALGVITFMLLCGQPPFIGESFEGTMDKIKAGAFEVPADKKGSLSPEALDYLACLLVLDPRQRLTSKAAQLHRWFNALDEEDDGSGDKQEEEGGGGGGGGGMTTGSSSDGAQAQPPSSPAPASPSWAPFLFRSPSSNQSPGGGGDKGKEGPLPPPPSSPPASPGSPTTRSKRANTTTMQRLVSFSEMGRFQRFVCEVLAFIQLSSDEIEELRDQFSKLDLEGEGEITIQELRQALASSSVAEVRSLASQDRDVQTLFDAVDFDHSGKIHWNECELIEQRSSEEAPTIGDASRTAVWWSCSV